MSVDSNFYCKLLVKWQVKDPFSMKSIYVPDSKVSPDYIKRLYHESRSKYNRTVEEAKKEVVEEHKDVIEKVNDFVEPLI